MHRASHELDQRDRLYRQVDRTATSPIPTSSSNKNLPQQTPTVSATVDRRSIGNSTVSPPSFYTIGFENIATYRSSRNLDTTDVIEPFPNRTNTLSSGPQTATVCRVSNLNNSFADSTTSVIPVESIPSVPVLPSSAQLDATVTCLWILTPLTATVSAVIVLVAITTNQWLHTEEKMSNPAYNGTGDKDLLSKFTVSGLWKICYTNPGEHNFECSKIDYFPKEEYLPDPEDSTMAIPYAVTKSSFFLLLATALMFAGYVCCAIGHCARNRRIFTFSSGVLFIVSGLLMLVGLVMYISVFKAEVGNKLREPSFGLQPIFSYRYGYSFLLYVSGFITIEMAGTSAVFLFIYWYQKDWLIKLTENAFDKYSPGSESSISYSNLEQATVYPCKKHPQAYSMQRTQPIGAPACEPSTSTSYISPSKQRRYFFEKDSLPPVSPSCTLHRYRNVYVSTSMRDVSVPNCYDFPPPPPALASTSYGNPYVSEFAEIPKSASVINYRNDPYLNNVGSTRSLHMVGSNTLPRDATTNTVSTTADIVNDDFGFSEASVGTTFPDDFSPSNHRESEFVRFDLDRPMEMKPSTANAGLNQPIKKNFGTTTDKLRRTTPV